MKKAKCQVSILIAFMMVSQIAVSQNMDSDTYSNIVFQSAFEDGHKLIWDDWDENPDTENQIIPDPGPFNQEGNHVIRLAVSPAAFLLILI